MTKTSSSNKKFLKIQGYICLGSAYDESSSHDLLYIVDITNGTVGQPLAREINDHLYGTKREAIVSWHIADRHIPDDALSEIKIMSILGDSATDKIKADYGHRYSELTGYLWTDETFKVGNHDMIAILGGYKGKWVELNIVILD